MEIFVFGDSIAYGAWDRDGGWVARLRRYIDEKIMAPNNEDYYSHLYNLGISGETSAGTLARFDEEMNARLRKAKTCAVVFAIGTNDSQLLLAQNEHQISLTDFERNIRALVAKARQYTENIMFVSTLVADDAKVNPIPWSPEKAFTTAHLRRYDTAIRTIADEMSLAYIDVATPFIAAGGTALLDDGIHPTTQGHEVIFTTVRDVLVVKGWV